MRNQDGFTVSSAWNEWKVSYFTHDYQLFTVVGIFASLSYAEAIV